MNVLPSAKFVALRECESCHYKPNFGLCYECLKYLRGQKITFWKDPYTGSTICHNPEPEEMTLEKLYKLSLTLFGKESPATNFVLNKIHAGSLLDIIISNPTQALYLLTEIDKKKTETSLVDP